MAVSIVLNQRAIASLEIAATEADLKVRANRVLNAARRLAPVDEGRLRASLAITYTRVGGNAVAQIGSNLPYAIFVEQGTGLYGPRASRIYPKRGKFMVWPVKNNSGTGRRRYKGGKTQTHVFARSTAGMKARPFLVPALDAAK